jgi:hypothetical protein
MRTRNLHHHLHSSKLRTTSRSSSGQSLPLNLDSLTVSYTHSINRTLSWNGIVFRTLILAATAAAWNGQGSLSAAGCSRGISVVAATARWRGNGSGEGAMARQRQRRWRGQGTFLPGGRGSGISVVAAVAILSARQR